VDFRAALRGMLRFEHPEQLCHFEWGFWPETIARWRREGMRGDHPWEELGLTFYDRVPVHTRLYPPFTLQVLSETDTARVIQDGDGIVKEVFKDHSTMPRWISHPVSTLRDFEALAEQLDPHTPGRFPADWPAQAAALAERNSILVMGGTEISFFGWHRDLMGLQPLMAAYFDQPELVHAISRHHLWFLKELYARILADVEFDFVFLWEDMSFKNGPLISPAFVREFMLPYYRELIGFFRDFGDYRFLLDSDGDVRQLVPLFAEVGVDGFLPFEVAAGMDVGEMARQYPGLILAGGLDKRQFALGRAAIERELERLPALFRRGGYLPSLDHHVPPEVSWADFQYYVERVRQLYAAHRP
jgi:uroporphyrinogen decarboxylase